MLFQRARQLIYLHLTRQMPTISRKQKHLLISVMNARETHLRCILCGFLSGCCTPVTAVNTVLTLKCDVTKQNVIIFNVEISRFHSENHLLCDIIFSHQFVVNCETIFIFAAQFNLMWNDQRSSNFFAIKINGTGKRWSPFFSQIKICSDKIKKNKLPAYKHREQQVFDIACENVYTLWMKRIIKLGQRIV